MAKKFAKAPKKDVDRKMKIGVIIMLVLLFMGFSVAGYYGLMGNGGQEQQPIQPQQDYGIGTAAGTQGANVGQMTGGLAIFGQLDSPVSLARRLKGDLFYMNNGASSLIFTKSPEADIRETTKGEYILYKVARCDAGFDCLVEGPANGTMLFDVYRLDKNSTFVTSSMVGMPSSAVPIAL